ncbi:MAG: type II toxin-antitoxin system VapC family toxin [Candidatus Baldrarchaeia archaeon]
MDTNVIIARYKPADPLHKVSDKLLSSERFEFLISPITLFELYSVISRLYPNMVFPQEVESVSVDTLVHFIVEDCNLKLASKNYLVTTYFRKRKMRMPFEYLMSMMLAEKLKLRALDLLHIAYVAMLRDNIQTFVTGNGEILERKSIIKDIIGIKVEHPKDFLNNL